MSIKPLKLENILLQSLKFKFEKVKIHLVNDCREVHKSDGKNVTTLSFEIES